MKADRKRILKRTRREEIEFRKLQRAISQLPKPAFNNPEKIQPTQEVTVPTAVPASLQIEDQSTFSVDEKQRGLIDKNIILDNAGIKIERLAKTKPIKSGSIVKRLKKYLRPNIGILIGAICLFLISSALDILIPFFIGKGIDFIVGPGEVNFEKILIYSILLAVTVVAYSSTKWFASGLTNMLSYRIENMFHNEMFIKFGKVPLKYIDSSSHGDLQSRMINDVDQITDGFVLGFTSLFDCLASIIFTLSFMFVINPIIASVIVALTPLSIIAAFFISRKSRKLFTRQTKNLGDMSGAIVEYVGNQKVVNSFQYEGRSEAKFDVLNEKLRDSTDKAVFISSTTGPISRFINGLIYSAVAILGTFFALDGGISVGSISTLLSYANQYASPFNQLADVFSDVQTAIASARRVFNVLDIENEVSDENLPALKRNNGNVDFINVDFSYSKEKRLIQNLNLKVKKGQKVAIVGPTGCGKSTLINLIMRFYDVDSGEIRVSNKSLTQIKRSSLRKQFGMVLQETWLFGASIKDNIAYGKPNASMREIKHAAKMAGVDHFIQTLPNGYDTILNQNGDNLSQGQKQLICIARIMLTRPPMLILDEATSNIDTRTELAIQDAFNKIMKGRTSFVVAHRLSTITSSDIILVMNKGNIIEQGTHKELLNKKGFYYNLYNSQFSNY